MPDFPTTLPVPADLPPQPTSELLQFDLVKDRIYQLIKEWTPEQLKTDFRRRQRKIDVNIDELHAKGKLKPDETLIPIRVIDSNIAKEEPPYVAFIKQSRRLAIFESTSNPNLPSKTKQQLERQFTEGMSYSGWETPFIKCRDGASLHGWDAVEIELDESKPLHANVDQVGHDNLLFPWDAKDIQACEIILRKYSLPPATLKSFRDKYGFDRELVDELLDKQKQKNKEENITVYKKYCKADGIVWISWVSNDQSSSRWLKAPTQLNRGRKKKITQTITVDQPRTVPDPRTGMPITITVPTLQPQTTWEPIPETKYPIRLLKYEETEEQKITDTKGRAFKDGPKQEAQTAMWSIFVNGSVRAGNVYSSPKNSSQTGSGRPVRLDNVTLEHGCIYSEPMEFWHTDYPDPGLVRATNALETQNQVESGQIAFAVTNREDSRKTATESNLAQQQQQSLNSTNITIFSTFIREVVGDEWLIVQSQALQGLVTLMPRENPDTGQQENDEEVLSLDYSLKAAGDVDVIERSEKLQKRMALWPMVAMSGLKDEFMLDILREAFPDDADRYEKVLQQSNLKDQLIMSLSSVLKELVTDPRAKAIVQPHMQEFKQLAQEVQMVMGGEGQGQPQGSSQTPQMQSQPQQAGAM